MMDLWLRQPATFLPEALAEGFRNFSWHIGISVAKHLDPISRVRAYSLPYGERTKMMLIDYPGAPEYDVFSSYDKPIAVYPTWAMDEPHEQLIYLCKNPPGDNSKFYNDKNIAPWHRPVKGQKHRIVVHRIDNGVGLRAKRITEYMLWFRNLEAEYDVEIFVSGLTSFDHLFGYNMKAADYRPVAMRDNLIFPMVTLPSGKLLADEAVYDKRYKDWFDLLDFDQGELLKNQYGNRRMFPAFGMRAAQWARANWDKVEPFVIGRHYRGPADADFSNRIMQRSDAFVLPAARRRVMRNIGFELGELDRFACDVCILHNTCTLYRKGSVCTVKGTEAVALADAFGTRNADRIIDGLGQLLERQAERLEDAMAAEEPGSPNPDITRQINGVFANGVKLAKLINPSLAGGPNVQVNVGVSGGGTASIVAQQDPRQLTAVIVREFEQLGIAREDITAEMFTGYFKSMHAGDSSPARTAIAASGTKPRGRKKIGASVEPPEDYAPEEEFIDKPEDLLVEFIDSTTIEGEATDGGSE